MEYKGFTYTPTPKTAWDNLSMLEKSEMMKVAVRNGITDLKTIREKYNEFAEGGYLDWKEKANKYKHLDIDNDRTYDYEGWYNENPQRAWDFLNDNPDAHFDDKYKTVYHPTFSTQSKYSGQKDATYNPQGLIGGTWNKQGTVFTISPDGNRGPVSMDERKWYLENAEDNGVQLREADSSLPVFDGIPWGGVLPNVTITGNKFGGGGFMSLIPMPMILPRNTEGGKKQRKVLQFLPVVGTAINAEEAIHNPTQYNIVRTGISAASDLFGLPIWRGAKAGAQLVKGGLPTTKEVIRDVTSPWTRNEVRDVFRTGLGYGLPLTDIEMDVLENTKAEGGKIHIKPSHRGRLTELKARTGKTEAELYNDGNPAHRKMVVFARNARKWHGEGGSLQGPIVDMAMASNQSDVNLYGWGDWLYKAYNGVKKAVNKGREVVRTLGLDKSPSNHLMSWIGVSDSDMTNKNQSKNNNLGFFTTGALDAGRMSGINKVVKGDKNDIHYRTNLFNMVDPTNSVPDNIIDVLGHAITVSQAKSEKTYPYKREHQDATADAAWAKRLGLPYNKALLPDNTDGSVRLSQALEQEIPTDTTFLKNRIADNEKLLTKIHGKKRKPIEVAVDLDKAALNALRETYSTGKPVGLNEFTHNSRGWLDADLDKVVTPLSLLHRYTVQYDKDKNRMNYWDTYDFDEFEDFVPGEPFFIRGSIDLNKKK